MLLAAGWNGLQGEVRAEVKEEAKNLLEPLKALCGGEALQPDLAAELRARGVELWNMYGPTETTIWSAHCKDRPGGGNAAKNVIRNASRQAYRGHESLHP